MVSPTTDRRLGLAGNTAYKVPATVVATANITQSGEQTIDTVAVKAINAAGRPDRVLCVGMTDATKNGLWDVQTSAWTRSKDADGNYDLVNGTQVQISQGSLARSVYVLTTLDPITVGTTAQTWLAQLINTDSLIGWSTIYTITGGVLTRYSTLAAAVAGLAATVATIVVRADTVVPANLVIPSTASLRVENNAQISVSVGQTLTINGECDAPNVRVFAGAGTVVFGNLSRAKAPRIWFGTAGAVYDTQRTVLQTDGDTTGPVHAYEDNNTLQMTHSAAANFNAYASFDAATTIAGAGTYDHWVGFQSRPTYTGSGSISARMGGFNFLANHTGSGTIAAMHGMQIENPLGAGTINFLAGLLIQQLDRGAETWGIYSATPANTVSVGGGLAASWLLRGNGQTGGFGLSLQSKTDSSAHVLQTANKELLFGTNNTYYGAITAAGLWKMSTVGVTDILSANQRLEVSGVGGATFKATGGAAVAGVLNWNNDAVGNALFEGFYTEVAATQRGSIDYNRGGGLVRYNTTSDATLKNVIGDAPQAKSVEILEQTRLREYAWKEDASQKAQIGVIAQELYEVFKGAVSVGGDHDEPVSAITEQRLVSPEIKAVPASAMLDADGKPLIAAIEAKAAVYETVVISPERIEKRYRPWGVDKTAFTFHLVAGFQHQQARIAALEKQVAQLVELVGRAA